MSQRTTKSNLKTKGPLLPPVVTPEKSQMRTRSRQAFTKTRMCVYFQNSVCYHGDKCSYAHEEGELHVQPNLKKTKMCPNFLRGRCSRGETCTYAHGRDELRGTSDVYKTRMCAFWMAGRCKASDACRHAHGEHELRDKKEKEEREEHASTTNSSPTSLHGSLSPSTPLPVPPPPGFTATGPLIPDTVLLQTLLREGMGVLSFPSPSLPRPPPPRQEEKEEILVEKLSELLQRVQCSSLPPSLSSEKDQRRQGLAPISLLPEQELPSNLFDFLQ